MKILQTNVVSKFNCLQGDCPDTCCKGWSMQLDDQTFEKYKNTELENAVDYDGEIRVMKRDKSTDFCVKFTEGTCAIHTLHGASMLGDACNFYPRVTRKVADQMVMTSTLSCPEIVRLSLFDGDIGYVDGETPRIPSILKQYEEELSGEDVLKIHQAFIDACKNTSPAERIAARIYNAADSINYQEKKDWPGAASFMLKMADMKLPPAQDDDANNYKLLQILAGIIHATKKKKTMRLLEVISFIETALAVQVDWGTLNLFSTGGNLKALDKVNYDGIMKKYLEAQISFGTFPFAGLGENIIDKAKLIIFKFALIRLALMSYGGYEEEKMIQIVQSISRIIDHIANPTLTLNLMNQCGWDREAKLRGLLSDK